MVAFLTMLYYNDVLAAVDAFFVAVLVLVVVHY